MYFSLAPFSTIPSSIAGVIAAARCVDLFLIRSIVRWVCALLVCWRWTAERSNRSLLVTIDRARRAPEVCLHLLCAFGVWTTNRTRSVRCFAGFKEWDESFWFFFVFRNAQFRSLDPWHHRQRLVTDRISTLSFGIQNPWRISVYHSHGCNSTISTHKLILI